MKAFFFSLLFAGVILTNPSAASASNPQTIIKKLINAMQKEDAKVIRSVFAKNASQAYGDGSPKSGPAFHQWIESDVIKAKAKVSDATYTTKGNQVVLKGKIKNSYGYSNKANFLFTVENGLITSWKIRY